MENMAVKTDNSIDILQNYAQQGRMFLARATEDLIQFGRILCEAKPLIKHGEFGKWVETEFGFSKRAAENYMSVYKRFGSNETLRDVKYSSLKAMLMLPEGTETSFAEDNDLADMTAREVQKAVEAVREECKREFDAEHKLRLAADKRADMIERGKQLPSQVTEELERLRQTAEDAVANQRAAAETLRKKNDELRENEDMMAVLQKQYDALEAQLASAQSAVARGDADRKIDENLTCEQFAAYVRSFIGSVAQMPYMGSSFALMGGDEVRIFDQMLQTVEDWCRRSRSAISHVQTEVICCE